MRRAWPLFLGVAAHAQAADRVIEEVRLGRENGVAIVDVVLLCPVDYLDHVPAAGVEVSVRIELAAECREAVGTGIRSELHEPPRTTVAAIRQVQFDTRDGREATVSVKVSPVQRFTVSQGRARNIVRVELRPDDESSLQRQPLQLPEPEPVPAERPPGRRLRLRANRCDSCSDLPSGASVTRSSSPPERVSQTAARSAQRQPPAFVYVNEHDASGGGLQELRLGFFADEQEARTYAAASAGALREQHRRRRRHRRAGSSGRVVDRAARAERRGCRSRAGSGTRSRR